MRRIRGGVWRATNLGKSCGGLEGGLEARIEFFWAETSTLCALEASETFALNFWPSRGGSDAAHQRGAALASQGPIGGHRRGPSEGQFGQWTRREYKIDPREYL